MMRLLTLMGAIAVALCVNNAAVLFNVTNALAQNAPLTDCDRLAANPNDPQRKATGVRFNKIDANTAISACETAVRQYPNDGQLNYQLGRAYLGAKNYQAAVDQFAKTAAQGYAPAQNDLGVMYTKGWGVAHDDAQAVSWYRQAAEPGYAPAQNNLGLMYMKGQGVAKDDAAAVSWYRSAADQGYAPAQFNLGSMYLKGRGVAKDDAEADSWYRKAADQGYGPAQITLGFRHANGGGAGGPVQGWGTLWKNQSDPDSAEKNQSDPGSAEKNQSDPGSAER